MGFKIGIETGSADMIQNLMNMKPAPFKPSEWPQVVGKNSEEATKLCINQLCLAKMSELNGCQEI